MQVIGKENSNGLMVGLQLLSFARQTVRTVDLDLDVTSFRGHAKDDPCVLINSRSVMRFIISSQHSYKVWDSTSFQSFEFIL